MTTVLFDLDGTLTQPASGIINSFTYALEELGRAIPDKNTLGWIIGPALRESFGKFLDSESEVENAIRLYREFYTRQGIFDALLFDSVPETLEQLQGKGHKLFVCTAKPRPFAIEVLKHFGILPFFSAVYGPGFDGQLDNKADLLNLLLTEQRLPPQSCCLIGDRHYDAAAALANAVTPIGALWGFGSREELEQAGIRHFCHSPQDIPHTVALLSDQ